MIFWLIMAILVYFTNFLNRLSLLNWWRRIPNVRILKNFIVLINTLMIWLRPIGTKASIGGSKIAIVGKSKAVIILVYGIILVRQLFFLRLYNITCIKVDPTQHPFDILDAIFLLYDFALKESPILNAFS